jgi:penicillin amidase
VSDAQAAGGIPAMTHSLLRSTAGIIFAATILPSRIAATPLPRPTGVSERLAAFPRHDLPLEAPATIHWNEQLIPFVEAQTDRDLPVILGLIHAHLRLAQMEMSRRVARGRVSEITGPVAFELDHALRLFGFGRAADASIAAMPAETREWLDAFVAGLNCYVAHAKELPHEFAALGFACETWTVADVLAIGRLAASDINWAVLFRLLPLRGAKDWPDLWRSITGGGGGAAPPRGKATARTQLLRLLSMTAARGSNAVAVQKSKSTSGGSLLAGDPHLPILLPNIWLGCGYRSPSHQAVGLMLPGLPFIAIGRNPWIAWGGTNAHAMASDLVDVSSLEPAAMTIRDEVIAVRWWGKEVVAIRETPFGPVITDAGILKSGRREALALQWLGHRPSDEITAMLRVSRARNWEEFRASFQSFAVPGQNMVYADQEGHIGKMIAAKVPARPPCLPEDLAASAQQASWDSFLTGADLPASHDPPGGIVVSANEAPAEKPFAVGYFFSPVDRAKRLAELLSAKGALGLSDLASTLTDVYATSSVALRDALLPVLRAMSPRSLKRRDLIEEFAGWDGRYARESRGALAFELLVHHFARYFLGRRRLAAYSATWSARRLILQDVESAPSERAAAALARSLGPAARALALCRDWGDMHRIKLVHPLGSVPVVGRRYRFADLPAAGCGETVFKTAHDGAGGRHGANYGSIARYFFDLADTDRNYFVLLGGQDGWLGSSTFLDQVPLWESNGWVQVPLRPETVRVTFRHKMELLPRNQP